ncbi:ankyrin repeat and LEM domain-containing protein 1 isoform X2 [Pelodiscus sinensis]|uniref:ankyrin repeat and LEM domain-containing protein 1 isoform X2 n=1 Tax=Pelodiscus sinensis TaxID=13735 RepID=UPI003F6AF3D5
MSRAGPASLAARLCEALHGEEAPLVETLLKQGADPNLVLPEGIAAIHLAAGKERESGVRCLKLILQYGGNPNARSVEGLTPLHVAASWGCYKCLKLLLRNGGDPHLEDQDGNRAIDLALEQGNKMCVQTLQGFRHVCVPEEADGASEQACLGTVESFFSTLTDDCTETSIRSRLSEAEHEAGPLSSTQKCRPARSPKNACDYTAAASASGRLSWIPGKVDNTLTLCAYSCSGHPRVSGLPQPLLSSTWLLARHEPQELASGLSPTQGLLEDEVSACLSSETDDGLTPPGSEDPTESSRGLSSQPAPCQDESVSNKPPISSPSQHCPTSLAAPARRRVSFCESPKMSPKNPSRPRGNPRVSDTHGTLHLSRLSDSLDLETLVNGQEGLDVTSPDHVFLFCRANSTAISDLEKTVMQPARPGRTQDGSDFLAAAGQVLSGSLESSGSQYGSCASECYVSAADASDRPEPAGKGGCSSREGRCCSFSLCAGDERAGSSCVGSGEGSSPEHSGKQLLPSAVGHSREELVDPPSAMDGVMRHLSQKAQITGERHVWASFEASQIVGGGSGLTPTAKLPSEGTSDAVRESLPSPPRELPAEHAARRGSNVLSTWAPRPPAPSDLAVETGPRAAASSVSGRQGLADGGPRGELKGTLLCTLGGLSARPGLPGSQWGARKAETPEWDPSANPSDVETPDAGPPGGAAESDPREEERSSSPFGGPSLTLPSLSSEADTLVIQRPASPAEGPGEDAASPSSETQETFPTTPSLPPMRPRPCHVTPRTKSRLTSAARDGSSSSSLFDETLEMPRRPRRVRSPPGTPRTPVGPGGAPVGNWVAPGGENASWGAEDTKDLDATEVLTKATGRLGSSPAPSGSPEASPTVLLDAEGGTPDQSLPCHNGEAGPGAAGCRDLPPCPSASSPDRPPLLSEDGEDDCPHQAALAQPLAVAQAEPEAARDERSPQREHPRPQREAKRQPGPSRVSFSRLSCGRPSGATVAAAHFSGRLSPVPDSCGQDVPLSPGGRPANLSAREPVEYLYLDEEEGYALIERHVPCADATSVPADTTSSEDTIIYDWRAYRSKLAGQENQPPPCESPKAAARLHCLSDEALLRKLRKLGADPGPVNSLTRQLYVQLLDRLMKDPTAQARKRAAARLGRPRGPGLRLL